MARRTLTPAVKVLRDGREICNQLTKAGRDEYQNRKRAMWERQDRICCLYRHVPQCPGRLNWADAQFEHEVPCGMGGGSRDDRMEIKDPKTGKMKRVNGAAHALCNALKGSRRIPYNAAWNAAQESKTSLGVIS